jgi:hypothetical protein
MIELKLPKKAQNFVYYSFLKKQSKYKTLKVAIVIFVLLKIHHVK